MENVGVKCDVAECIYNCCNNKCSLEKIEVTHMKTGPDSMAVPHFCKSYEKKQVKNKAHHKYVVRFILQYAFIVQTASIFRCLIKTFFGVTFNYFGNFTFTFVYKVKDKTAKAVIFA